MASGAAICGPGRNCSLTNDHSMVADLVAVGVLKRDDARTHPDKNEVLRAIGMAVGFAPEMTLPIDFRRPRAPVLGRTLGDALRSGDCRGDGRLWLDAPDRDTVGRPRKPFRRARQHFRGGVRAPWAEHKVMGFARR
ncbi:hypothetical protein ACCAA_760013 [Candidatus Accumulibacter aalborgensis]|uniref:Uncharacterized protein n=1 Tax=Candidatus Accumulibacter aalborgensis TaxID=1860102 RepID=A0A1A8Y070_9PROT|nr:hypothetical protein ACCAA_760013 [Candidatus Accumulibacter aalborgensis]